MDFKIPEQLKDMKFCRVAYKTKKPFEKDWTNKLYSYEEVSKFFPTENYGVQTGINNLGVLDDDTEDNVLINLFEKSFGDTFKVREHEYINLKGWDGQKIIFYNLLGKHCGELQGKGQMVVGPGSVHPSGETYELKKDIDIKEIDFELFKSIFQDYIPELNKSIATIHEKTNWEGDDIKDIPITNVISLGGLIGVGDGYQGSHPLHGSTGGMNFRVNPATNTWYCFRCHPKDTEIPTPSGFVKIQEIRKGDYVFGKGFQYNKVCEVMKHLCNESIYKIKTYTPDIKFTETHPILIASIKYNGKHLLKKNPIISWKLPNQINPKRDFLIIPKTHIEKGFKRLNSEIGEILGWYLAEGHLPKRSDRKNNGNGIVFTLSIKEEDIAKKLSVLTKKHFNATANYYKYPHRGTIIFQCHSKKLKKLIQENIGTGSYRKKIGKLINAPKPFLKSLISSYIKGDGHLTKKGSQRVSSVSKTLIKEVQIILFKLGIPARYYYNEFNGHHINILQWQTNPKYKSEFQDKNFLYLPIKSIEKEKGPKIVYSIKTKDNTYLIPFIVHNCNSGGSSPELIAVMEGIIDCSEAGKGCLAGDKGSQVIKIAREKYGLKAPELNQEPQGWALSVNIKKLAERYDFINCLKCNQPFYFNELLGQFKCKTCGDFGGLKLFADMIINNYNKTK